MTQQQGRERGQGTQRPGQKLVQGPAQEQGQPRGARARVLRPLPRIPAWRVRLLAVLAALDKSVGYLDVRVPSAPATGG